MTKGKVLPVLSSRVKMEMDHRESCDQETRHGRLGEVVRDLLPQVSKIVPERLLWSRERN